MKEAAEKKRMDEKDSKIKNLIEGDLYKNLLYNIHKELRKKIDKKNKELQNDPDTIEIFCPQHHLLEKTSFKPKED
jgi:hypothetical protein